MIIQTVKEQKGGGYIVNAAYYVPNDPNNKDYRDAQEWIAAGNSPDPSQSDQEILDEAKYNKKYSIRLEALNRIEIYEEGNNPDATNQLDELKAAWETKKREIKRNLIGTKADAGGTLTASEKSNAQADYNREDKKRLTMVEADTRCAEVNAVTIATTLQDALDQVDAITPVWPAFS